MELTSLTAEEILQEIRDLAQYQGITVREAWDELVNEVVDAHLDLAEFNADEDLEGLKENLRAGWSEYEEDITHSEVGLVEDEREVEDEILSSNDIEEDGEDEEGEEF